MTLQEWRKHVSERKMWFNHWKQLAEKQRKKYESS